jgi:hypothetical protein
MHVWRHAALNRAAVDGTIEVELDAGDGSAPDAKLRLRPTNDPELPPAWRACFASHRNMLEYVVPQDRALSPQPWYGRVCRQEINLGIPLDSVVPLTGTVESAAARVIVGADAKPLCFLVPRVAFRFAGEAFDVRN